VLPALLAEIFIFPCYYSSASWRYSATAITRLPSASSYTRTTILPVAPSTSSHFWSAVAIPFFWDRSTQPRAVPCIRHFTLV